MTIKTKAILTATGVLLLALLVRRCDRPRVTPTAPGKLAPTEKEHVTVGSHRVTIIRADKTVTEYVPGRVDVSIRKDGRVDIHVREFGLCAEPGFGGGYNGVSGKEVLDVKFLYYHRLGLNAGLSLDFSKNIKPVDIVKPLVSLSYVPFIRFANTSVFVGTELFPSRLIGGLRVAF